MRTNERRGLAVLPVLPAQLPAALDAPKLWMNLLSSTVSSCDGSNRRRDLDAVLVSLEVAGLIGSESSAFWPVLPDSLDLMEACTGSRKRRDLEACLLCLCIDDLTCSVVSIFAAGLFSSLALGVTVVVVCVCVVGAGALICVGSVIRLFLA